MISIEVKVAQGSQGSKGFSNELMTLAFISTVEKPENL